MDFSGRVHESRNPSVCALHHPSAVLDGPQRGKRNMLICSGSVPPPAVVRQYNDKLRPTQDKLADKVRKSRFVANDSCKPFFPSLSRFQGEQDRILAQSPSAYSHAPTKR